MFIREQLMGCDIHTIVAVRDSHDGGRFAPVYGTIVGERWSNDCYATYPLEPRYFRNYNVFGILTGGTVRGGTLMNCFDQEIPDDFDDSKYCLPENGQFPFNKIKWSSTNSKEGESLLLDYDATKDEAEIVYTQYDDLHREFDKHTEDLSAIRRRVPIATLQYYFDNDLHSHNYFTLKQLKKLIKRIDKLSKHSWLNSETKMEINGVKSVLKDYKKDIEAIANLAGVFLDKIDDNDVVVLICFDS